ncbi:MAG: LPS translocon maturation chaperone LptM [Pseudomonadota bacterium]
MMPSAGVSKSRSASSSACSMRASAESAAWLKSISVISVRATISRMRPRALYIVVSLLLCSLALAACGSKGELYLPEKPSAPQRITN